MNVRLPAASRSRILRYGAAICLLLGELFIVWKYAERFGRRARSALPKPILAGNDRRAEHAHAGSVHQGIDIGATPAHRAELAAARAADRARSAAEGGGRLRGSSP